MGGHHDASRPADRRRAPPVEADLRRAGAGRRWRALAALAALSTAVGLVATTGDLAAQDDAVNPGDGVRRVLWVTVRTRSDAGRAFCACWRGPEGYPRVRAAAFREAIDRELEDHAARMYFDRMVPGEFAVACFHDENANNDLDRTLFGIPLEGTGASNGARGFMGPPRYEDARFTYPEGVVSHHVVVPITYGW